MLNLVAYDITDRSLLENSYNALTNKDYVEIVADISEKEQIFKQTVENVKIPNNSKFTFQNLFKLKATYGHFYIVSARKPLNPLSFLFFRIKINHEQSIIIINFIEFRYNYCYLFGIKNNPFA